MADPSDIPSPEVGESALEARLESWKAIAAYLQRDVSTVQRWEKIEGLPVRRLNHAKQGSVYALKGELDAWRNGRSTRTDSSGNDAHAPANTDLPPARSSQAGVKFERGLLAAGMVAGTVLVVVVYVISHRSPNSVPKMTTTPITAYPGEETAPSFSPDGTQIAFQWHRGNSTDIYVGAVEGGGEPLRITTNPSPSFAPKWSPDGRWIAFARAERDGYGLMIISPLGGVERRLGQIGNLLTGTPALEQGGPYHWISWIANSKSILCTRFDSGNGSLSLISVETGEIAPLAYTPKPTGGAWDVTPAVSPDGRNIAFARSSGSVRSQIYIISSAGGAARRLTDSLANIAGLTWTPDGKEIVFGAMAAGSSSGLYRIPINSPAGAKPEQFEPEGCFPAFAGSASRGKVRLAYSKAWQNTNMVRLDRSTSGLFERPGQLLDGSTRQEFSPQVSPDGNRLVFTSDRSGHFEVYVSGIDGRSPLKLTSFGGPFVGSPHWSPDGNTIIFDGRDGNNVDIYSIPSGGGLLRRLTTEPSIEARPSYAPDGRTIYFRSDHSGKRIYYSMAADGQSHPASSWHQMTSPDAYEAMPSTDGTLLFFTRYSERGLFSVPVQGGAERKLSTAGMHGLWTTSERALFYTDDNPSASTQIMRLDLSTGRITKVGFIKKQLLAATPALTVSRDERFIIYIEVNQSEADLMLIDNFR